MGGVGGITVFNQRTTICSVLSFFYYLLLFVCVLLRLFFFFVVYLFTYFLLRSFCRPFFIYSCSVLLLYFILFYCILFYLTLCYLILFYPVLFYPISFLVNSLPESLSKKLLLKFTKKLLCILALQSSIPRVHQYFLPWLVNSYKSIKLISVF